MSATQLLALFAALSVVVAVATVVVEVLRHRRRAEARMSAAAFLLRRQLESWLSDHEWPSEGDSDSKRVELAAALTPHFDPAERRATSLLEESGDAGGDKARQAMHASALFFEATSRLNVFLMEAAKPEHRKAVENEPGSRVVVFASFPDVGERLRGEFDGVPEVIRRCIETLRTLVDKDLDFDAVLEQARRDEARTASEK